MQETEEKATEHRELEYEYDRVGVSKYCRENGIELKEKRKPKEPER